MGRKIQSIGQYTMDGVILGKGNFARVELATHRLTNLKVAIKVMDTTKIKEDYVRHNMHREAKIMGALRHPNIIRLYETLKATSLYCMVTEYVDGGDLLTHIKAQKGARLGETAAHPYFRQLLSALNYIHERGVVHRDLKMENIMLNASKTQVKIIDFGLSNVWKASEPLKTHCGSPEYAAPELFVAGKTYGPEIDIWSLGIITYAMILGRLPFTTLFKDEYQKQQMLQDIQKGLGPKHDRFLQSLSSSCQALLRILIEPDPTRRAALPELEKQSWVSRNGTMAFQKYVPPPKDKRLASQMVMQVTMMMGLKRKDVAEKVKEGRMDELSAMFNMMVEQHRKAQGLYDVDHTLGKTKHAKKLRDRERSRSSSRERDKHSSGTSAHSSKSGKTPARPSSRVIQPKSSKIPVAKATKNSLDSNERLLTVTTEPDEAPDAGSGDGLDSTDLLEGTPVVPSQFEPDLLSHVTEEDVDSEGEVTTPEPCNVSSDGLLKPPPSSLAMLKPVPPQTLLPPSAAAGGGVKEHFVKDKMAAKDMKELMAAKDFKEPLANGPARVPLSQRRNPPAKLNLTLDLSVTTTTPTARLKKVLNDPLDTTPNKLQVGVKPLMVSPSKIPVPEEKKKEGGNSSPSKGHSKASSPGKPSRPSTLPYSKSNPYSIDQITLQAIAARAAIPKGQKDQGKDGTKGFGWHLLIPEPEPAKAPIVTPESMTTMSTSSDEDRQAAIFTPPDAIDAVEEDNDEPIAMTPVASPSSQPQVAIDVQGSDAYLLNVSDDEKLRRRKSGATAGGSVTVTTQACVNQAIVTQSQTTVTSCETVNVNVNVNVTGVEHGTVNVTSSTQTSATADQRSPDQRVRRPLVSNPSQEEGYESSGSQLSRSSHSGEQLDAPSPLRLRYIKEAESLDEQMECEQVEQQVPDNTPLLAHSVAEPPPELPGCDNDAYHESPVRAREDTGRRARRKLQLRRVHECETVGLSPSSPTWAERHSKFSHVGSHALDCFVSPDDAPNQVDSGPLWRPVTSITTPESPTMGSSPMHSPRTSGNPAALNSPHNRSSDDDWDDILRGAGRQPLLRQILAIEPETTSRSGSEQRQSVKRNQREGHTGWSSPLDQQTVSLAGRSVFTQVPDTNLILEPLNDPDSGESFVESLAGSMEKLHSSLSAVLPDTRTANAEDELVCNSKQAESSRTGSGRLGRMQIFSLLQSSASGDKSRNKTPEPEASNPAKQKRRGLSLRQFDPKSRTMSWREGLSHLLRRPRSRSEGREEKNLLKNKHSNGSPANKPLSNQMPNNVASPRVPPPTTVTRKNLCQMYTRVQEMDARWTATADTPSEPDQELRLIGTQPPKSMYELHNTSSQEQFELNASRSPRKVTWSGIKSLSQDSGEEVKTARGQGQLPEQSSPRSRQIRQTLNNETNQTHLSTHTQV